jgi:hypothetical protein
MALGFFLIFYILSQANPEIPSQLPPPNYLLPTKELLTKTILHSPLKTPILKNHHFT